MIKAMISLPDSKRGGPYVSHLRIINSCLSSEIVFTPFSVPRISRIWRHSYRYYLANLIEKTKPDIIIFHGLEMVGFSLSVIIRSVIRQRIPILVAIHGSSSELVHSSKLKRRFDYFLEKRTLKNCSGAFAVSEYASQIRVVSESDKCLGVVYNLPDSVDRPRFARSQERISLGFAEKDFVVASSGRIVAEKGYDELLSIILSKKYPDNVRFLIIGDGDYLSTMKKEIALQGIQNTVFVGFVENIGDYLSASDAFIMCTKHETLCTSVIEAGSFSLPVIATEVGGIPEIIPSKEYGLLYHSGDINTALSYLIFLDNNDKKRQEIGANLQRRIAMVFSEKVNMGKLFTIINTLVKGKTN